VYNVQFSNASVIPRTQTAPLRLREHFFSQGRKGAVVQTSPGVIRIELLLRYC